MKRQQPVASTTTLFGLEPKGGGVAESPLPPALVSATHPTRIVLKVLLYRRTVDGADGATRMLFQLARQLRGCGHEVVVLQTPERRVPHFYPAPDGVRVLTMHLGAGRRTTKAAAVIEPLGTVRKLRSSIRQRFITLATTWAGRLMRKALSTKGGFLPQRAVYYSAWKVRYAREIRKLTTALAKEEPDVVVAYFTKAYFLVAEACSRESLPLVCSMHSAPAAYRERLGLEYELLMRSIHCHAVVVLDPSFEPDLAMARTDEVRVIGNTVDLSHFSPPGSDIDRQKRIVTVGRLVPVKNHALLIAAFSSIANQFPEWDLHVIGSGRLRGELVALASETGVAERVHFRGLVENVAQEFKHASIHVMPSLHEGFGLALIEAMASGVPSVVLDTCQPAAGIVFESGSGLLAKNQSESLALVMARLMADDHLRRQMGESGVGFAGRFTDSENAQKWLHLLQAQSRSA